MFTAITIFRIVLIIFLTVAALDSAIAETGGSPESSSGNGVCVEINKPAWSVENLRQEIQAARLLDEVLIGERASLKHAIRGMEFFANHMALPSGSEPIDPKSKVNNLRDVVMASGNSPRLMTVAADICQFCLSEYAVAATLRIVYLTSLSYEGGNKAEAANGAAVDGLRDQCKIHLGQLFYLMTKDSDGDIIANPEIPGKEIAQAINEGDFSYKKYLLTIRAFVNTATRENGFRADVDLAATTSLVETLMQTDNCPSTGWRLRHSSHRAFIGLILGGE